MKAFYKNILLFILNYTFLIFYSFSQNLLVKQWDKRFGGIDFDKIYSFQQTSDEGYILGGHSQSDSNGDVSQNSRGLYDFWIVKTDLLGNKQWDRRFGGTDFDELYSLKQTTDGGYILGGPSLSGIGGDKTQPNWDTICTPVCTHDYWVVKTDSLGTKQWEKRFGGTQDDVLHSLQQTTDGGYILGGFSYSGISGDKTQPVQGSYDYWIVKIDTFGNKQWDKTFGGTSSDGLFSLHQTTDRGYILGGYSFSDSSGDKTQPLKGGLDYWIVKTDSLGNK